MFCSLLLLSISWTNSLGSHKTLSSTTPMRIGYFSISPIPYTYTLIYIRYKLEIVLVRFSTVILFKSRKTLINLFEKK